MIFKLSVANNDRYVYISSEFDVYYYDILVQEEKFCGGRLTLFERKFKRLQKNYTTSVGSTITYGVKSAIETLKIKIECTGLNFREIRDILSKNYEYTVFYQDYTGYQSTKTMRLVSDIEEEKIFCSNTGLYTITVELEEV